MKARCTDEQIIAMIKEQEAGEKTLCVNLMMDWTGPCFYDDNTQMPAKCVVSGP